MLVHSVRLNPVPTIKPLDLDILFSICFRVISTLSPHNGTQDTHDNLS